MPSNFPGLGDSVSPLPSGDPALPSHLVGAYAAQQVNAAITQAQSSAMMTGQIRQMAESAILQTIQSLMTSALGQIAQTTNGGQPLNLQQALQQANLWAPQGLLQPGAPGQFPGQPGQYPGQYPGQPGGAFQPFQHDNQPAHPQPPQGTATPSHAAPTPAPPPEGGAPRPAPGGDDQQGLHLSQRYTEGYQRVQNASMGSIARAAGGSVSRYVQNTYGRWISDSHTGELYQTDDNGNEVPGSRMAADDPRANSIRRGSYVASAMGRFAAGQGGVIGSLGGMVAKGAGVLGMGISAIQMGGHFLEQQNQAASQYRADFGQQGTGMFAASDRIGEAIAGLQGFGTIGGDRARAQYEAASGLGLRGDQRDQATGFASDMYLRFGMDTSQAMEMVSQTVTDGRISLEDFASSITKVSEAAVAAGRTSSEAIKEFQQTQQYVQQNVVSGPASVRIASNVSRMTDQMPMGAAQALGGAQGVASMLGNTNTLFMAAATTGQNPMAMYWQMQGPGQQAVNAAQNVIAGGAQRFAEQVAAMLGHPLSELQAEARRMAGPAGQLSADQQYNLFQRWAGGAEQAGNTLYSMAMMLPQFGLGQVTQNRAQILNVFFQAILGKFGTPQRPGDHAGRDASGFRTGATGQSGAQVADVNRSLSVTTGGTSSHRVAFKRGGDNEQALLSSIGYGKVATYDPYSGGTVTSQAHPEDQDAFNAYLKVVNRTGTANKALNALLSGKGAGKIEAFTGGSAGDARFQVYDASGKGKEVSLADAISNPAYRSQLISGRAQLIGKSGNQPESVSHITGYASTNRATPAGQSPQGGGGGGASPQRVQVEFTGDAKRFLRITGPSDSQRAGVPANGDWMPSSGFNWGGQ